SAPAPRGVRDHAATPTPSDRPAAGRHPDGGAVAVDAVRHRRHHLRLLRPEEPLLGGQLPRGVADPLPERQRPRRRRGPPGGAGGGAGGAAGGAAGAAGLPTSTRRRCSTGPSPSSSTTCPTTPPATARRCAATASPAPCTATSTRCSTPSRTTAPAGCTTSR